ncbi:MAG TPA: L,D-transpeptidase family protein [Pyrinomonadaceae bacterium]|nr:L,D-transpeptidase family protein [Pyrinomonadaceae bacterium]
MKAFLAVCLLLISTLSIAGAQQSSKRQTFLKRAEIKEAERRLAELGYWTGAVDGVIDSATRSAVVAFQKCEGRAVTGRLTNDELDAIRLGASPEARELGYEHVEVDVDRQLLLLIDDKDAVRVLPISSGSEKEFPEAGETSVAHTPRGRFIVYDKVTGWDGPPGGMYYSNYFSGGVAIHGYPSVPNGPASHGCIRIPIFAAREVSQLLPVGTIVLIYDSISFVSAKPWVENPQLKQAVLLSHIAAGFDDDNYQASGAKGGKSVVFKKARTRMTRAD